MFAAPSMKAYFDETGTHKGAPLVCVAGYLFDNDAANKFKALHGARVKPLLPESADLTGDFCTSGSEREFTQEGRWYADEEVQAGADRHLAAAD